jgi:hypothetical protein
MTCDRIASSASSIHRPAGSTPVSEAARAFTWRRYNSRLKGLKTWLSKGCSSHVRPAGTSSTNMFNRAMCAKTLRARCWDAQSMIRSITARGFALRQARRKDVRMRLKLSAVTHPLPSRDTVTGSAR